MSDVALSPDEGNFADLELDPNRSNFISIWGRKGTGKSVLAGTFFRSYPYDELVIDSTGDVDPDGAFTTPWPTPPPKAWPEAEPHARQVFRLVPNHLSPAWRDDVDRAIGTTFFHGRTCLWLDEVGELCPVRCLPHTDLLLHQGRHRHLTVLFCGPRPVDLNPLVLSQSDWVFIFDVPHDLDIDRLALVLGIPKLELRALIRSLGEHEFLGFNAITREITVFPALPV